MGQKIHPTGFRLAVNRDWTSKWYANSKHFPAILNEDIKVRAYLKKKLAHASVGKITRLLSRLQADRKERSHALIDPVERLKEIVDTALLSRPAREREADVELTGLDGEGGAGRRERSAEDIKVVGVAQLVLHML